MTIGMSSYTYTNYPLFRSSSLSSVSGVKPINPVKTSEYKSDAVVMSLEHKYAANAVQSTKEPTDKLLSAAMPFKDVIQPEYGTSYIPGKTTGTMLQYNETNPYEQARKVIEGSLFTGQNLNLSA